MNQADLAKKIQALYKKIDILVNNAGAVTNALFQMMSLKKFKKKYFK